MIACSKDEEEDEAPTIEISDDGYWVINGVKTEHKATGEDGEDGETPTIEISDDGYWIINGVKTEYKAVGEDGNDGETPTIEISDDGYWVINGVKTEHKASVDKDNGGEGDPEPEPEPKPEPELPGVDILREDLSDYVEIDEQYYKNYTVKFNTNSVSELEIENYIIQALCQYKSKTETVNGDGVITAGDVAHIFYKGYYIGENGEEVFFNGGDNTGDAKAYELEIGSGNFILGFEYNLIGKNPSDYSAENPLIIETFFPKDYKAAELAGKTAYFIVTVDKLVEYDAPALTETFLIETLGFTAEGLSDYPGDTMIEKYKSYVKEQIMYDNGLDLETVTINAFWESALSGVVIKKYPEKQLKEIYDSLLYELDYYYSYYYSYYYKRDDFMCLYMGLEVGSDWQTHLQGLAKAQLKEKLLFFRIMEQEGLRPTAEEYDALFDEYLDSALASNKITVENCGSEEAYNAKKATYKQQMLTQYGEDYFVSMIYYNITMEAIIGYANVVEITE